MVHSLNVKLFKADVTSWVCEFPVMVNSTLKPQFSRMTSDNLNLRVYLCKMVLSPALGRAVVKLSDNAHTGP